MKRNTQGLLLLQTIIEHKQLNGHGIGTIIAYNTVPSNQSFFNSTSYPYVVSFESGKKEVYAEDELLVISQSQC